LSYGTMAAIRKAGRLRRGDRPYIPGAAGFLKHFGKGALLPREAPR